MYDDPRKNRWNLETIIKKAFTTMNIYYIDYENVSSQGLKGVEALTENDEVNLLYSKKADNVKIDILTMMMESKARIRFLPVHVGTPNALDFQLVTLLFLNYREGDHCYIISKDSGYDCCIKTAAENGAPNVARYPNIESALNGTPARKTRSRGKRAAKDTETSGVSQSAAAAPAAGENHVDVPQPAQNPSAEPKNAKHPVKEADQAAGKAAEKTAVPELPGETPAPSPEETGKKKTSRRRGRKKTASSETEGIQNAEQNVTQESVEKAADAGITSAQDKTPDKAQDKAPAKTQDKSQDKAQDKTQDKTPDKAQDKAQEHVLQQRYLSKQFESKAPQASTGVRGDAEKPVSILSVIRRRNDVQLDMHQIDLIREALKNSGNKQQFYSYFVKNLGQKQGIELYHSIKSSYTDLMNANLQ